MGCESWARLRGAPLAGQGRATSKQVQELKMATSQKRTAATLKSDLQKSMGASRIIGPVAPKTLIRLCVKVTLCERKFCVKESWLCVKESDLSLVQ